MLINIKVKTLDAQTHEFSIDNEITVREFKDKVAEKTNIAADQQRIIYCGRVMVDDKQLKEYDVNGKVVHVAERPPPSQRLPSTDSSSPNANPSNERRNRGRAVNMRNSPFFRALDGMVVGTMAFPMNANTNGQDAVNPFAASSSFCMNRITVARHMLECANNIAAFLEDPTRGLNNQSLDILARGRWTMESTVVEVGITSDVPQSQQIVEMVQGAVQAALRRSGNTNVTLVQLPAVYSSNENEGNNASPTATEGATATDNEGAEVENSSTAATSIVIEDVTDEDEDTPTNEPSDNNSATASPVITLAAGENNGNATATTNTDDGNDNSRRRTGTPVLASVIEQMRRVQTRLDPFIQQYYELLQNEPTFGENDTTSRENAQRLFDRVSEAFHYMSHAQHAISDLMLDVSQGTPRYLTCRPILVEQSGYVSSNNFLTPAMLPAALRQQQPRNSTNTNANSSSSAPSAATTTAATTATAAATNSRSGATTNNARSDSISGSSDTNNSTVDDPIDDPVVWQPTLNFGLPTATGNTSNATTTSNNNTAASGRGNLQRQVARLLQDVVSAAPFDTEFHVHINTPNVVSIDVPVGVSGSSNSQASEATNGASMNNSDNNTSSPAATAATVPAGTEGAAAAAVTSNTSTTSATTNDNTNTTTNSNTNSSSSSSTTNPARVTTATLPTTSTQTRSTSRPQVHFGNIPVLGMPSGWNGRVLPSNNVSSFDRFLPCNSHHIREPETPNGNASNTNENASSNNVSTSTGAATSRNNPTAVGSTMTGTPRSANSNSNSNTTGNSSAPQSDNVLPIIWSPFGGMRQMMLRGASTSANATSTVPTGPDSNQSSRGQQIRSQFMNCLKEKMFEGRPINEDTIIPALDRAVQWFGEFLIYLPQYEKPEYDARNSLFNLLKTTLRIVISLLKDTSFTLTRIEEKLKEICEQFRNRMYSILYICIGEANTEMFWAQLMRLLHTSLETSLPCDIFAFFEVYLDTSLPTLTAEYEAQQFIVRRNTEASRSENMQMERPQRSSTPRSLANFDVMCEMFMRGPYGTSANGTPTDGDSTPNCRGLKVCQLVNCLNNTLFEGRFITEDIIPPAIDRAIQWFDEFLIYLPQYEKPEYNSRDSLFNILRSSLLVVAQLLKDYSLNLNELEQQLKQMCEQFRNRLYSVLYICIGQANTEIFWLQLMRLLRNSLETNLPGDVFDFIVGYLNTSVPSLNNEADVQQFIVRRNAEAASSTENVQVPMDTDVEMAELAATTSQSKDNDDDEPLPSVVPGSENWHRHFPNDWLPIIACDIQRQTDNPPKQPPYSDAYISGMSSKRRKLVQSSKPPMEICDLIADSVKKAIQTTEEMGTSPNSIQGHTPEVVAVAISTDPTVQSSCIDAVRTNVRDRLKKDTDFEADKFPKSNKFINK